jgi:hypothetical protein
MILTYSPGDFESPDEYKKFNSRKFIIPMKKLNFIRFFISLVVFLFYYSEISFAQLTPPEQEYVLSFSIEKIAIAPVNASLNLGSEFTMEAWIFVNDSCDGIIMGKIHDQMDSDPWKSYLLRFEDRGKSMVFIQTTGEPGSYKRVAVSYTKEFRTWTHVAATLGNDTMRVYIDGIETGWEISPGVPNNTTVPFSVGNSVTSDGNQTSEGIYGAMAQVRVWNKALTTSEIVDNASIYLNGDETGLVAYWPLDDGEGQIARDLSVNGLNLTLGTTTDKDNYDPEWTRRVFIEDIYFTVNSFDSDLGHSVLIDFDDDGDLDVVGTVCVGGWSQRMKALKNDGNANFEDATTEIFGSENVLTVNPGNVFLVDDFNGDNKDDLFIQDMGIDEDPYPGAPNRLFIQSDDGRLMDETENRLPDIVKWGHSAVAGDIDNNGGLDILVMENFLDTTTWIQRWVVFYMNDGNGYFTTDNSRVPHTISLCPSGFFLAYALEDVDNDGDIDFYAGTNGQLFLKFDIPERRGVLFLNDGTGHFVQSERETIPLNNPIISSTANQPHIMSGDINNDGWIDFVEVRQYNDSNYNYHIKLQLLLNDKNGKFIDVNYMLPDAEGLDYPEVADLNNDGFLDIIAAIPGFEGGGFKIFYNRGNTDFVDASSLVSIDANFIGTAGYPGDLDNDGDTDLFMISEHRYHIVLNQKPFDVLNKIPLSLPDAPQLINPENNSNAKLIPDLEWSEIDLKSSYRVQISTDSLFWDMVIDSSGILYNTLELGSLTKNQTYYWRVCAVNASGASDWSAIWSFTPKQEPQLYYPSEMDTVSSEVIFKWNRLDQADTYWLQISKEKDFSSFAINAKAIDDTSFHAIDLEPVSTYYWRVKGLFSNDTSAWSEIRSFFTQFPEPFEQSHILRFNQNHIAVAPLSEFFNLGNEYTIEVWVKNESMGSAVVLGKSGANAPFGGTYAYWINSDSLHSHIMYAHREFYLDAYFKARDYNWNHIATTYSDSTMRLFFNGVEMEKKIKCYPEVDENSYFSLGNLINLNMEMDNRHQGYTGSLKQIKIWNKALTVEEIIDYAGKNIDGNENGLLAYWPLDDGQGQIARDLTANGLDLMLGTTTEEDDNDPEWINSAFIDDTYFTISQHENYNIGQGVLIDFDNDSDLDFIGTHYYKDWGCYLRALENDGESNFSDATLKIFDSETIELVNPGNQMLAEDFNNDGLQDLFIGDMGMDAEPWGGAQNKLFLQTSDGKMSDKSLTNLPQIMTYTHAETSGDIDNDGDIDIFLVESTGNLQGMNGFYINDGYGNFTQDLTRIPAEIILHDTYWSYTLADADNDGDEDLFGGSAASRLRGNEQFVDRDILLLNDGEGNFDFAPQNTFPSNEPSPFHSVNQPEIFAEDINNDGFIDFIEEITGVNIEGLQIKLYFNNGNVTFRDVTYKIPNPEFMAFPYAADFNNDGNIDIIASERENGFKLLLNRGNADFIDVTPLIPVQFGWFVMAYPGDLDNDGDTDILITTGNEFYIVRNIKPFEVTEFFPVPIPDAPVLISPGNKTVTPINPTLVWSATDYLGFNLQVAPAIDFLNPVLDTFNMPLDTLILTNLDPDTEYFWRVNAANTSGTSEWSEVWSFITSDGSFISNVITENYFNIFPNPAHSFFYIEIKNIAPQPIDIEILNLSGQLVYKKQSHPGINKVRVNMPYNIGKCIYFVKIQCDNISYIGKLIIY